MLLRIVSCVALFAASASADSLCLHSTIGEGYDSSYGPVNTAGYSTKGTSCQDISGHDRLLSISTSETDPSLNSGPLVEPHLFLWAIAGSGYGFWSGYASYEGSLAIESVEPLNGAIIEHTVDPPYLSFVWPSPPYFDPDMSIPVARLTVSMPIAVEKDTWGRVKALYR